MTGLQLLRGRTSGPVKLWNINSHPCCQEKGGRERGQMRSGQILG